MSATGATGATTGVLVTSDGEVPAAIGADRDTLARWGFTGRAGRRWPGPPGRGRGRGRRRDGRAPRRGRGA
ncbi:hypothetical protein NKG05_05585 [Oerskovia sp. M15]